MVQYNFTEFMSVSLRPEKMHHQLPSNSIDARARSKEVTIGIHTMTYLALNPMILRDIDHIGQSTCIPYQLSTPSMTSIRTLLSDPTLQSKKVLEKLICNYTGLTKEQLITSYDVELTAEQLTAVTA